MWTNWNQCSSRFESYFLEWIDQIGPVWRHFIKQSFGFSIYNDFVEDMGESLVLWTPDCALQFLALVSNIVLCPRAKHISLAPSMQEYDVDKQTTKAPALSYYPDTGGWGAGWVEGYQYYTTTAVLLQIRAV